MIDVATRWIPDTSRVASKVIDGEAIIINLVNGAYYSLDGAGALAWGLIAQQSTASQIVDALVERYDVAPERALRDLENLVDELQQEGLVAEATLSAEAPRSAVDGTPDPRADAAAHAAPGTREPYVTLRLNCYRDMADLLALDPPTPGVLDELIRGANPETTR